MAVNPYSQAAQLNLIDTYVPIPFDQIMRFGETQRQDVARATQDLTDNIQRWAQFRSPSVTDTQAYYDLTLNSPNNPINELVSNPELLKTAEGRSKFQSWINNIDYSALSQLQQSSQNLQTRQQNIANLTARGLYNPDWDDVDITSYDTLNSGILNDLSPIEYQSIQALADPVGAALKDSDLGARNWYQNYVGVDENAIRNAIGNQYDTITQSPQAQYHLRDIARQMEVAGITPTADAVRQEFINRAVQSQASRIRVNVQSDPSTVQLWATRMQLAASERAAGVRKGQSLEVPPFNASPREIARAAGNSQVQEKLYQNPLYEGYSNARADAQERYAGEAARLAEYSDYYQKLRAQAAIAGDQNAVAQVDAQLNAIGAEMDNINAQINRDAAPYLQQGMQLALGNAYGLRDDSGNPLPISQLSIDDLNAGAFATAANEALKQITSNQSVNYVRESLNSIIPQTGKVELDGINRDVFLKGSSQDLVLPQELAADVAGVPELATSVNERFFFSGRERTNFNEILKRGDIGGVLVEPTTEVLTYADRSGTSQEAVKVRTYIPIDNLPDYNTNLGKKRNPYVEDLNAKVVKLATGTGKNKDNIEYLEFETYLPIPKNAEVYSDIDNSISQNRWRATTVDNYTPYQLEYNFNNR